MPKGIFPVVSLLCLTGCQWSVQPPPAQSAPSQPVIYIFKDGTMSTSAPPTVGWMITKDDFPALAKQAAGKTVLVVGDNGVPYSKAVEVKNELIQAGVADVALQP